MIVSGAVQLNNNPITPFKISTLNPLNQLNKPQLNSIEDKQFFQDLENI